MSLNSLYVNYNSNDDLLDNKGDDYLSANYSHYLIDSNKTITDAFKQMDEIKFGNLIVKSNDCVVGMLTDGDIRRALLKGFNLADPVKVAMKYPFISLKPQCSVQEVISTFQNKAINLVPIIDDDCHLKNVITRQIFEEMILSRCKIDLNHDLDDYDYTEYSPQIVPKPWGYYKTMIMNKMFQSKILYIMPKQQISLQLHKKREEHWIIINGNGEVQLDDSIRMVKPGDVIFIPKGCKHRITNIDSDNSLILSETQLGDYFGEDDIIRIEDDYGRL